MVRRAVFLDKDGTLVENVPFNVEPGLIRFTPHAMEALRLLSNQGFLLILVSNQPGLARGLFSRQDLAHYLSELSLRLAQNGINLTGCHICPHDISLEEGCCTCQKPRPGLIQQAADVHGINLRQSWVIGDILNDVEAGQRAGCGSILLDVGNETEWVGGPFRNPHFVVKNLWQAASIIVKRGRHKTQVEVMYEKNAVGQS